jgi:uncharacterized protein (DUF1499 family)
LKAIYAIVVLALITLVTSSVWLLVGPKRLWSVMGLADLGPVDFGTLQRRKSPNDSLACPPHFCKAASDFVPPIFTVNAQDLRAAMAKVIALEPNVTIAQIDNGALVDRYIQRTPVLQFPDTIVVRYVDLGPGERSTLAIYSRSQLGYSDFGVNKARIARWLDKLEKLVPVLK